MQTLSQFSTYLDGQLENRKSVETTDSNSAMNSFNQHSWSFWKAHLDGYQENPENYHTVLEKYYRLKERYPIENSLDLEAFDSVIESYRRFDRRNTLPDNPFLFVGSSSIVYWEIARAFPSLPVINRGFGGASMNDILHHYDDVIKPHNPRALVIYCDIDIEMGAEPESVIDLYKTLIMKVEQDFPSAHIILVDHILGRHIWRNKKAANEMLKTLSQKRDNRHFVNVGDSLLRDDGRVNSDLFSDGMHLNESGYKQWNPLIKLTLDPIAQAREVAVQ